MPNPVIPPNPSNGKPTVRGDLVDYVLDINSSVPGDRDRHVATRIDEGYVPPPHEPPAWAR